MGDIPCAVDHVKKKKGFHYKILESRSNYHMKAYVVLAHLLKWMLKNDSTPYYFLHSKYSYILSTISGMSPLRTGATAVRETYRIGRFGRRGWSYRKVDLIQSALNKLCALAKTNSYLMVDMPIGTIPRRLLNMLTIPDHFIHISTFDLLIKWVLRVSWMLRTIETYI